MCSVLVQRSLDVGQDAAPHDGRAVQQLVELGVVEGGQLQAARDVARLLSGVHLADLKALAARLRVGLRPAAFILAVRRRWMLYSPMECGNPVVLEPHLLLRDAEPCQIRRLLESRFICIEPGSAVLVALPAHVLWRCLHPRR